MKAEVLMLAAAALFLFGRKRGADNDGAAAQGGTPMGRAMKALESMDLKVIRATSKKLRAEGHTQIADAIDQGIPIVEKMIEARKKPTPIWPADADPVAEFHLLNPPTVLTQDDLMVAAWLRREDNGAPPFIAADLYPDREKDRPLTPRERWFLAPYFPVAADLDAELNFGMPPGTPRDAVNKDLHAFTFVEWGKVHVRFPNGPLSMLARWSLALLAHELFHGSQFRLGMQAAETVDSIVKWGYQLSPIEVQARYYQRLVYADLVTRARAFWLGLGPMPMFP